MKIRDKREKKYTHDKQHFGVPLPKCLIVDRHIFISFTMGHSEISSFSSSFSVSSSVWWPILLPVIARRAQQNQSLHNKSTRAADSLSFSLSLSYICLITFGTPLHFSFSLYMPLVNLPPNKIKETTNLKQTLLEPAII